MSAARGALPGQVTSPNSSFGLRDLATGLFNRKWLIICTLFTSVVATAVFASYTPEKYESRMKFLVKNMRLDTPVTTGKEEQVVSDNGDISESQLASEIELIHSRDILAEVVKRTGLAKSANPGSSVTDGDI